MKPTERAARCKPCKKQASLSSSSDESSSAVNLSNKEVTHYSNRLNSLLSVNSSVKLSHTSQKKFSSQKILNESIFKQKTNSRKQTKLSKFFQVHSHLSQSGTQSSVQVSTNSSYSSQHSYIPTIHDKSPSASLEFSKVSTDSLRTSLSSSIQTHTSALNQQSKVANPYKKHPRKKTLNNIRARQLLNADDRTFAQPFRASLSTSSSSLSPNDDSSYSCSAAPSPSSAPRRSNRFKSPSSASSSSSPIRNQVFPSEASSSILHNSIESTGTSETPSPNGTVHTEQPFNDHHMDQMIMHLSQQPGFQSQESLDIITKLSAKISKYKQKREEYEARSRSIEKHMHTIQQHQSIIQQSTSKVSITLGQFTLPSLPGDHSSPSSSTSSKKPKHPFPSRFQNLNFAAGSDDETFLTHSPSESSASSPLYCPIEEVSSSNQPAETSSIPPLSFCIPLHTSQLPNEDSIADDSQHHDLYSSSQEESPPSTTEDADSLLGDASQDTKFQAQTTQESTPTTARLSTQPCLLSPQTQTDTPTNKYEGDIRVVSQNCRGAIQLGKSRQEHYVPSIESFRDLLADVVLLSETNVDWKVRDNHYDTHLANRVIFSPAPVKTTTASCSWDNRSRSTYQPGGVLSIFTNHVTPRIVSSTSDPYGRWTKTVIQIRQRNIVMFNTYRTHIKSLETAGSETPWMQQWTAHRQRTGETSDPRSMHVDDLIVEIQQVQDEDDYVLVVGDFNEDFLDPEVTGIKKLQSSTRMVQAYEHMHGSTPSSRHNSRHSFHTFVSPELLRYVRKLGICSVHDGFSLSDHVPFFIDFHAELFSEKIQPILPSRNRILRMYDTISVSKYVTRVNEQFQHHNIPGRIQKLRESISQQGFQSHHASQLEALDTHISQIRLQSEQNLLRPPTPFKFTSVAKQQVEKIRLLQRLQRKYKAGRTCQDILERLSTYEFIFEITPENLPKLLTQERQSLKQIQSDIDFHREEHLDKICAQAAAEKDRDKETIMKEIKNREKQKRSWQKIRYVTKPRSNGVSRLGIPVGYENRSTKEIWDFLQTPYVQTEFSYITDPDAIEKRLVEWQYLHYMQASETPLADAYWYDKLNPCSITDDDVQDILNGAVTNDPTLHPSSKCFFQEISDNVIPDMPPSLSDITSTKFRSFYSTTKESTSSSPSGLHVGHWKAAATCESISFILTSIINIAVTNSYTLRRWKRVIGVLLEKTKGKPTIHKFRTIHLVESDLNFVMRLLWGKSLMMWGEKNGAIHDNQYGGRKGIQAQSAALNKTLTLDIIRYHGQEAAIIDNDAQACYDRIIPVVLAYALLRMGLPLYLVRFQCKWLETSMYELKMNNSISTPYQSTVDKYLFGTGQGTGWSPPSWAALSDIISRIMNRHIPGMKLGHPDGSSVERTMDAFVDDANGGLTTDGFNDFTPSSTSPVQKYPTLYEQTEANVQFYGRVLFTTGGRLALHKCAISLLRTLWRNGKRSYENTHITTRPLTIQQGISQDYQKIKIVSPKEARRMLGVYVAPDGNCDLQTKLLRSKSEEWSQRIRNNRMATFETLMSYNQGLMKSLEFPLGASLLTESQCKYIQSPALSCCLQKSGVLSTISRSVIFGPKRFCGLGFSNLYTEAGIQKLELLIGHIRKMDVPGQILSVALACLQQEVGISTPVLLSSYSLYSSAATTSWCLSVWKFLHDISGSIRYDGMWTPKACFQNDTNIMEQIATMDFTEKQKYQINICRLYKRVYYLGELLTSSGTSFRRDVFDLTKPGFHNNKFPLVCVPPSFQELWKSAILSISKSRDLGTSLGPLQNSSSYEYCLEHSQKILFRYHRHKIVSCHIRSANTDTYHLSPSSICFSFVPTSVAEVKIVDDKIQVIRYRQLHHLTIPPSLSNICTNLTFSQFQHQLERLSPAHYRNFGLLHVQNWDTFLESFRQSDVIAVTDASVNLKTGCHSYIIETTNAVAHVQGQAPVDADPDDITSTRAERCGVLAIVSITTALARLLHIQNVVVTVYCDNLEALKKPTMHNKTYTKLVAPDMDIKMEILSLLKRSPVSYRFLHVKGHADAEEGFVYEEADQEVQRNIDMDASAKDFLLAPPPSLKPTYEPLFFPAQKLSLQILGVNMVGNIRKQIYLYRHGSVIEESLQSSMRISPKQLEHIEWEGIERAFTKMSPQDRVSRMKIVHMLLPTRSLLKQRNEVNNDQCLRCRRQPETFPHLFECTCRLAQSAHRVALKSLRQKLRKMHTHVLLVDAIASLLDQTHQGHRVSYKAPLLGDTAKIRMTDQVFHQQLRLGKFSLHRGIVSRNWMVLQNDLTSNVDSNQKNFVWLRNLIRALWTYSHDVWVSRCKHVHTKNPDDFCSMNHEELIQVVRSYLKLDSSSLSAIERKIHLNVTKKLPFAHSRTLVRWIHLLKDERARTENGRRNIRRVQRNQQITRFFSPNQTHR